MRTCAWGSRLVVMIGLAAAGPAAALDNDAIGSILERLNVQASGEPGHWRFDYGGATLTIITDARADRMRIVAPVTAGEELSPDLAYRLLQANFDTALDARYALARGVVWSTFIHPLGALTERQLLSGIGQVINLVSSFGTSYSSGELVFGGGDTGQRQRRRLIEELIERGSSI
ncbi:MAG: hypothetical protein HKO62_05430 [Gammaproteobacteria bacterium]|nr:hypothetical protein [Gammaproteobacteria bacterium]